MTRTLRQNVYKFAPTFLALFVIAGCATAVRYATSGSARHVEWRTVDLERSRSIVDGRQTDAYSFTLVLRETRGVTLTFTELKNDIYQGRWEAHGQTSEHLELPPYCEAYIPLSSTGFSAPLWTITLVGADESGQPVRIAIDAALPPESGQQGQEFSRDRAASALASPSIEAGQSGSLASLTVAERKRIQTLEESFVAKEFDAFLASGEERKVAPISGAVVTFDPRVPQVLRRALRNIAGGLIAGSLRLDSTVAISLNLPSSSETQKIFRFTYIRREGGPERCSREVLIEPVEIDLSLKPSGRERPGLVGHRFVIRPGWLEQEAGLITAALEHMPERWLRDIEGLTFSRVRSPSPKRDWGGYYTTDGHTITMYDEPFKFSDIRFAVSDRAGYAIGHEIGHALDFTPLRRAADRYRTALDAFERAFGRYAIPGTDRYRIPPGQEQSWQASSKAIAAETRAMEAVRSLSGNRWQFDAATRRFEVADDSDPKENAFRQAVELDGPVRITRYAEKSWSEYFAECFSIYLLDPHLLETLRPNIYAYFAKQFPR